MAKKQQTKDFNNIYPYDASDITPENIRDWPKCIFLLQGCLIGKTTDMGKYDGLPNIIFLPVKKKSGRGADTEFTDADLGVFKKCLEETFDAYYKLSKQYKYIGLPENIANGMPAKLANLVEEKLTTIL